MIRHSSALGSLTETPWVDNMQTWCHHPDTFFLVC